MAPPATMSSTAAGLFGLASRSSSSSTSTATSTDDYARRRNSAFVAGTSSSSSSAAAAAAAAAAATNGVGIGITFNAGYGSSSISLAEPGVGGIPPPTEKLRSMSLTPFSATTMHSARQPKSAGSGVAAKFNPLRLRSNSGLSLHTNDDVLREYTDYNPDGSPRSPLYTLSDSPFEVGAGPGGVGGGSAGSGGMRSIDAIAAAAQQHQLQLQQREREREQMKLQRRASIAITESSAASRTLPSIVSQDVFDMVMRNPDTANKMWKFAAGQGRGQDIEFLMKVRDYSETLDTLIGQLTAISTAHASAAATQPIRLPLPLTRSLNEDLKYVAASSVPSLETLFLDSRASIERRLAADLFPSFVKQQLALCTSMALSLEHSSSSSSGNSSRDAHDDNPAASFAGLGTAFCITSQAAHDQPLVCASDAYDVIAGYPHAESVGRSCRILQGPGTDEDTVARMGQAVWRQEETVELVLNHRRDGSPWWNLLYLCPIPDSGGGRAPLYLGAQIDVTPCVESHKDMMRLLSYNPVEAARKRERARSIERGDHHHNHHHHHHHSDGNDRDDFHHSFRSSDHKEKEKSNSKKSFFKPFKRSSSPPPMAPEPSRRSFDRLDRNASVSASAAAAAAAATASAASGPGARLLRRGLSTRADTLHTPYGRIFLLQPSALGSASPSSLSVDRDWASSTATTTTTTSTSSHSSSKKATSCPLTISFASRGALEVLGLPPSSNEAVVHRDIFQVLADHAGSPSLTRTFTSTIRATVLGQGKTAATELAIARTAPRRPQSSWGTSGGAGSEAASSSSVATGSGGGSGGGGERIGMERVMSYWTPLKGADNEVQYVVLILAPVSLREY